MHKFALILPLLVVACVVAAVYGAVRNQVVYAVSPEYFDRLPFEEFDLPDGKRGRTGAAEVGVRNTWWAGLIVGLPVLLVGLPLPGRRAYARHSVVAFCVAAGTAAVVELVTLAVASLVISEATIAGGWIPLGVKDRLAFARAATVQDFSCLGAGVGVFAAGWYVLAAQDRWRRSGRRRRSSVVLPPQSSS